MCVMLTPEVQDQIMEKVTQSNFLFNNFVQMCQGFFLVLKWQFLPGMGTSISDHVYY